MEDLRNGRILARPDAVNVAHVVDRCHVLGPGCRCVIWVQGCPLRCPGCLNPDFLPFRDAMWVSVDRLADWALSVSGIEGVTYAGGEPFAQAEALAKLSGQLRLGGLSVMAYSGYTYGQLSHGILPHTRELLLEVDLLMDGPYRQASPTLRPWRGSNNQQLIAISARYRTPVSEWNEQRGQEFEMRFNKDGEIEILGIPPPSLTENRQVQA